jgi:ribosome-associated toxin RatA of RatAB toxin-antitoxin module
MSQQFKTQSILIKRMLPGRPWKVLRLITRIEDFCDYMPNVKRSSVIEKTHTRAVTEWLVDVDGLRIRWRQEDKIDVANFTIRFKAIEGDLDEFEGSWVLKKGEGESTDVTIQVKARLGIPMIENVVDDILELRLRKNFEMMLDAIEEMLIRQRYEVPAKGAGFKESVKGFVVMGHPYNFQHLLRIFKFFKPDVAKVTPDFLLKLFELAPAYLGREIKDFKSETGKSINGYFVMCPIIPDMAKYGPELVLNKVIEGCKIGERLGAGILTLGGFTSIVGEKYFDKIQGQVKMPITTGNTSPRPWRLKACAAPAPSWESN